MHSNIGWVSKEFRNSCFAFREKYYEYLVLARGFLEDKYEDYPDFCCHEASYFLSEVFDFKESAGYFMQSFEKHFWHAWNVSDEFSLVVDIVQDQNMFARKEGRLIDKIVLLPLKNNILAFSEKCERYQKNQIWRKKGRVEKIDGLVNEFKKIIYEV
jgi:hypothetical protein